MKPGEEYDIEERLRGIETAAIARCMADCDDVPRGQLSAVELRKRGVHVMWPTGDPVYLGAVQQERERATHEQIHASQQRRLRTRTSTGALAFIS